ncbi:MAG: hypothetical protein ABJB47_19455, partial [Actinomycetota bacterium]
MHTNIGLAQFSESLLILAIVVYALAMLSYACDFAFGRQRLAAIAVKTPGLAGDAGAATAESSAGEPSAEAVPAEAIAVGAGAVRTGAARTGPPGAGRLGGAGLDGAGGSGAAGADVTGAPTAGSPATGGAADGAVGRATGPASTRWPSVWVRIAISLTVIGLAAHITAIFLRGISEDRVPWGNMYEFIVAITCMAVIVLVA